MALLYGVLRGRPDMYKREDGAATPHLQIRLVDETGQAWRIAVNVQSKDTSHLVYWLVDPLAGHPITDGLDDVPPGFSPQPADMAHALDYLKSPMFDLAHGRMLPPSGAASADDLQDLLGLYLDQCKAAGGEVFAFGAKFTEDKNLPIDDEFGIPDGVHGIHDIHMNQGNRGEFARDNGVFHDGGLILSFPDRYVGLFLAFQTQWVPTDDEGAPVAAARPLSAVIGQAGPAGPVGGGDVYIVHALINPDGVDPGHEVVVLGNLATITRELAGWQLVDRNGRTTTITTTIAPGATAPVNLIGDGVQLGNNGGNLILRDDTGATVDTVVYTAADATTPGRYVRFRR